jgi:hypothetical protein
MRIIIIIIMIMIIIVMRRIGIIVENKNNLLKSRILRSLGALRKS